MEIRNVVWFEQLDVHATPEPGQTLEYLYFGRGEQMYLVHKVLYLEIKEHTEQKNH